MGHCLKWIFSGLVGIILVGSIMCPTGLGATGTPARSIDKEPPFRLPLNRHLPLPDGAGIPSLYGEWHPYGDGAGGPLTITPQVLANYESTWRHNISPYRVLYTAENYVLIAYQLGLYDDRIWTEFGVFSLQSIRQTETGPYGTELREWTCGAEATKSAEAFYWLNTQLMQIFEEECAITINPNPDVIWYGGNGWNTQVYYRNPP